MRTILVSAACSISCLLGLLAGMTPTVAGAQQNPPPRGLQRTPWTTSRVVGTPDPPAPYHTAVAFPKLKFADPLELVAGPADAGAAASRLFVVERRGKILSFKNDAAAAEAELFLDVKHTVYGLAFHPRYAENGYVYVTYILPGPPNPVGSRLSRFKAQPGDLLHADPQSEQILFAWPTGGHNGGCIRFGLDGYLYLVTGDGSGIADERQTGQDVTDVLAAMLRIDVDHAEGGKPYAIPKDNPFADGAGGARPEIWAYGLRQAWKFSFDRPTKQLWAGEVGQDLWEMVYLIERGGNYGWSVNEGAHPFRPERKLGPTPIHPPVVEHPHSEFRSITGGYVYHGSALPDLAGAYVYADYDTGKIWALRYDPAKPERGRVTQHWELADTTLRIVAFGEDNAGELLLVDFIGGQLHKLVKSPPTTPVAFPRKLSETGLFASTRDHTPAPGVIPYTVNAPLWSDGAEKERFLAIPGDGKIEFDTVEYPQPSPGAPRGWRFPNNTVAVKTFSMELEPGNPASRKRLETRLLHVKMTPGTEEVGDQVWHGYTYIWNDEQTDAVLLEGRDGKDVPLSIKDAQAPGGVRTQTWHFPSRAECTLCHTTPAKYVLGLNTLQLNREHDYGGVRENQLAAFDRIGLFTKPLPKPPAQLVGSPGTELEFAL